jgi:protein lifeguard
MYFSHEPRHDANSFWSQFGGSVAEATIDIRNQFVRKVYTILTVQLLVTAAVSAVSFFNDSYKGWIQSHPALVWISVSRNPCKASL